jgi:hypothetical protein
MKLINPLFSRQNFWTDSNDFFIWGICNIFNKVKKRFDTWILEWSIFDITSPLSSLTCSW